VVPTDLGREYYESCLDIIARIDAATEAAKGANSSVSGRLRLSVPSSYTEALLGKQLDAFACAYQDVELVLHLSDKRVDLISDGFDAAIRIGILDDSTLFARKLGTTIIRLYASPKYLAERGEPKNFDDLNNHECIRYNNLTSGSEWIANLNGTEVRKRITGRFSSNSGVYNRGLAIAGRGIAALPEFITNEAVEKGELVAIMSDYTFPVADINILYPQKRNMPASLRALITHLTEQ
jgi:DNA-binding transcriptional LysR family regulator